MSPSSLIRASLLKPKKRKKEKKLAEEMCECRRRGETQPRQSFSQLFPVSDKAWNPLHKGTFVFTDVNQASGFLSYRFVHLLIKIEWGLLPDCHHDDVLTYAPYCKQYTQAAT